MAADEIHTGLITTREVRDLSDEEVAKMKLVAAGKRGFQVFLASDLDRTFEPWLCDSDGGCWIFQHGEPADGWNPQIHAVVVQPDGGWYYVWPAHESQRHDAPNSRAELEARARRRETERERQEAEARTNLELLRSQARPVTLGDLDPATRSTLAEAGQRVEQAGGNLEVAKGRLVISLPPTAATDPSAVSALRQLYLAETEVVTCLKAKRPLPDKEILPSGALAP
jgi:hypothetical protein